MCRRSIYIHMEKMYQHSKENTCSHSPRTVYWAVFCPVALNWCVVEKPRRQIIASLILKCSDAWSSFSVSDMQESNINIRLQLLLLPEPSVYHFGMCRFSKNVFPCITEEKPYNSCQQNHRRHYTRGLPSVKCIFLEEVAAADGRNIIHSELSPSFAFFQPNIGSSNDHLKKLPFFHVFLEMETLMGSLSWVFRHRRPLLCYVAPYWGREGDKQVVGGG